MRFLGNGIRTAGRHFRTSFVAGLLIMIPVVITWVILKFVFDTFDPLLEDAIQAAAGRYTPGMGIVTLAIIVYLLGLITTHVAGRRLLGMGNALVDLVPFVRGIYRTARQATTVLSTVGSGGADGHYTAVVFVEFPGYGLRSIGLVTSKIKDQQGQTLLAVYVPTSPFPTSGFLLILPEDQVTYTDLDVDEAMKLIVSAGIVAPDKIFSAPYTFGGVPGPNVPPDSPRGRAPQVQNPDGGASDQAG